MKRIGLPEKVVDMMISPRGCVFREDDVKNIIREEYGNGFVGEAQDIWIEPVRFCSTAFLKRVNGVMGEPDVDAVSVLSFTIQKCERCLQDVLLEEGHRVYYELGVNESSGTTGLANFTGPQWLELRHYYHKVLKSKRGRSSWYLGHLEAENDHPNVVSERIFSLMNSSGCLVTVAENLKEASSLEEIWAGLSEKEVLKIFSDAMRGCDEVVHEKGFVHRDVKPANIMVAERSEEQVATGADKYSGRLADFEYAVKDDTKPLWVGTDPFAERCWYKEARFGEKVSQGVDNLSFGASLLAYYLSVNGCVSDMNNFAQIVDDINYALEIPPAFPTNVDFEAFWKAVSRGLGWNEDRVYGYETVLEIIPLEMRHVIYSLMKEVRSERCPLPEAISKIEQYSDGLEDQVGQEGEEA